MSETKAYTCHGDVRGFCGVRHKTAEAAQDHCDRDMASVKRGHGSDAYSDRSVVDADTHEPVTICGETCAHDECY
jgi:hypothetical protein